MKKIIYIIMVLVYVPISFSKTLESENLLFEDDFKGPLSKKLIVNKNQKKIEEIIITNDGLVQRLANKYPNLDRLDLSFGISKSGDIGVFSGGKSKAIEVIWERREDSNLNNEGLEFITETIVVKPHLSTNDLAKDMVRIIKGHVNFKKIRRRSKRRLIKALYKDASKINKLVKSLVTTNFQEDWYISGFWRNYYFSKSMNLLDTFTVGYDKRVRFRFRIEGNKSSRSNQLINKSNNKISHQVLKKIGKKLQLISNSESEVDTFELYRCWASVDFNVEGNALIFSSSIGKGFLVEFRKRKDAKSLDSKKNIFTYKKFDVFHNTNNLIANLESKALTKEMPINQVRYIFSVDASLNFQFVSFEKESNINFQFKKKSDQIRLVRFNYVEKNSVKVKLKQLDYRQRGTFSFGIPFINRIRVRPSYEYRTMF